MHEVFAAVRIWQLEHVQKLPKHAKATGHRIFGKKRWDSCVKAMEADDDRTQLLELAFSVLNTSDWIDNPADKNRTMANMQLAAIAYVDERWPWMENWPIFVENEKDPNCLVGIEQHFDIILLFSDGKQIRYVGTLDGLVIKAERNIPYVDENKTANRLDDGWKSMFELGHQITGYSIAGPTVFGFEIRHTRVTGTKIKPTGSSDDSYVVEPLARDDECVYLGASS